MQLSSNLEKIFYNYVRKNKDLLTIVNPDFFQNKEIVNCYTFDLKFFKKYHDVPTLAQMENLIITNGENNGLSLEDIKSEVRKVRAIFKVDLEEYDPAWLKEYAEAWVEWKNFDSSFFDAISYTKSVKVDVHNIKEVIAKARTIVLERSSIDLNFKLGLNFWKAGDHFRSDGDYFPTGYNWFDRIFGKGKGYRKRALYCVVGPAKRGKSLLLQNLATNAVRLGNNTAFLSFEMIDVDVMARFGADLLNISIDEYDEFSQDEKKVQAKLKKLQQVDGISRPIPGSLYIKEFPTSAATVIDIETYLKKLEEVEKIKLKTVFVDYINIISNWRAPNSDMLYMKIKQIAEDLRAMAMRNDWTVITATQTTKDGMNNSNLQMTDVSESSGLVHTVDGLVGLMQDEEQRAEGVMIFKALALRHSGFTNERKKFIVDYDHMRITEDTTDAF